MNKRTKIVVGFISTVSVTIFIALLLRYHTISQYKAKHIEVPPNWQHLGSVPPELEDCFGVIDDILAKLEFGNIAFNAPEAINLRDTAVIQFMLSLETPIDELKQMIEAAGEKEGARIRVSDRMEARLSGPNFAITAITPETQAVSRNEITEWKWEIKPTSHGRHYLHLTVSALLNVAGTATPRAIRTFDKMIAVEVAWHQRMASFFENHWQWLWAAIVVPIAGWLWRRKRRAQSEVSQPDS